MDAPKIFEQNFKSDAAKKKFKDITGIDAKENPNAYIAYMNNIALTVIADDLRHQKRELSKIENYLEQISRRLP